MELCLSEEDGADTRINMSSVSARVWHVYLSGVGPCQRYGYRAHRPWKIVLNTSTPLEDAQPETPLHKETKVKVEGRSVVVLTRGRKPQ